MSKPSFADANEAADNRSRMILKIGALGMMLAGSFVQCAAGQSASFATIYSFTGQNGDGASLLGGLVAGPDGTIYGTTQFGGSGACAAGNQHGCGTVFALTPPSSASGKWKETIIYSFTGQNGDGVNPTSGVVLGSDGALYGTTWGGGIEGFGTVYMLAPPPSGGPWIETVLHSFRSARYGDGAYPYAALTLGAHRELYGTTEGGSFGKNNGSVFLLTPPSNAGGEWVESELYAFPGTNPNGQVWPTPWCLSSVELFYSNEMARQCSAPPFPSKGRNHE